MSRSNADCLLWRFRSGRGAAVIRRICEFRFLFAFACALAAPARSAGELTELDALHGRVVYLDFWASWCEPCRRSFPWMQEMKRSNESRGLTIIAVNLDRDRADADAFLKRFHPDFQIRFDPGGRWAEQFQVRGMPTSVVIDRHGVARFTHVGFRPGDGPKYARQLEELLGALNEGVEVVRRKCILLCEFVVLCSLLAGCSSLGVRPWQRELLSRQDMLLDGSGLDDAIDDHMYFSKEASSGGRSFGGGGCGCN